MAHPEATIPAEVPVCGSVPPSAASRLRAATALHSESPTIHSLLTSDPRVSYIFHSFSSGSPAPASHCCKCSSTQTDNLSAAYSRSALFRLRCFCHRAGSRLFPALKVRRSVKAAWIFHSRSDPQLLQIPLLLYEKKYPPMFPSRHLCCDRHS